MLLELGDLAARRRGGRVEVPCRGGEAARLSDRQHDRHGFEAIHHLSFPRQQAAKSERTVPNVGTPDPVEISDQASRALRRGAVKSRKARSLIGMNRPAV